MRGQCAPSRDYGVFLRSDQGPNAADLQPLVLTRRRKPMNSFDWDEAIRLFF